MKISASLARVWLVIKFFVCLETSRREFSFNLQLKSDRLGYLVEENTRVPEKTVV